LRIQLILAATVMVGVFVQVYLIATVAFGGGEDALDAHKGIGQLVHLLEILAFLAALIAVWPNWRKSGWPFALAVVGSVQAFLAAEADSGSAWVHGFHGMLALFVLLLAVLVMGQAASALGLKMPKAAV
jgi:hypothetical protein